MKIRLSDHFTHGRLLRFTAPSMIMMVFTSIYGVVDGIFVSNYAGKTAFAAVNLIMPYVMLFGAIGIMMGTGGTALISMTLGLGDREKANRQFSLLTYVTAGSTLALGLLGILLLEPAARLLGAEGELVDLCVRYGRIYLQGTPVQCLQMCFQSFCAAAEKPHLGLGLTVGAGITNIVLDALFVGGFHWGLEGAAAATVISQCVGGLIPLIYFARPNSSLLRLGKAEWDGRALFRTCTNGSSELMSNISGSVVGILYNLQLLAYAGEDGLAAYGVIMYVNFAFVAMFLGFSMGSAPVVGYHYGAGNQDELKSLLRKSLTIVGVMAVAMCASCFGLARPMAAIFVSYDTALLEMTVHAFRIYAVSFLLCGFNIFGSGFFTALNNGPVSAAISFVRTLVCQVAAVLILPMLLELDGVWWSVTVSEVGALVLTAFFLVKLRKRYRYF